jgi:predicted dehydrogenase
LKELPSVEIAGVCDLSPATAEAAAERFGVARWFTDYRDMLRTITPDVVHVTTSPPSHHAISIDALEAGAHVFVEKPAAVRYDQVREMLEKATRSQRLLLEDHNYLFNESVQRVLGLIRSGDFGEVVHVEVMICLDILGKGSRLADPDLPHPSLALPGGAIAEFLTHLAYLAYAFVGAHRSVGTVWGKRNPDSPLPSDEFRALVDAERGTAALGFSSHVQPDVFWLRVYGTKMRSAINLFEPRLTIDRVRRGPRPLTPLINGWHEAKDVRRSALGGLWRKLGGGPGAYEGLWELLRRTYDALARRVEPPVSMRQIDDVNRLVADLTREERVL